MCSVIRFSEISWVTGKRLDPEEKGLNCNKWGFLKYKPTEIIVLNLWEPLRSVRSECAGYMILVGKNAFFFLAVSKYNLSFLLTINIGNKS